MNIHEYQAKQILASYNVNIQEGIMVESVVDAVKAAQEIKGDAWVLKAQVHAGGRGKAGGIRLVRKLNEIKKVAEEMLGMKLITNQTGGDGKIVSKLYIEKVAQIKKEYYLAVLLDRASEMPVIIASTEGGIEIEKVAVNTPEKIVKVEIDPLIGLQGYHIRKLAFGINLEPELHKEFSLFLKALYSVYSHRDATLVEINPLVLTSENNFVALDAKIGLDDNSLFRQKDILRMRDLDEENPAEVEAWEFGLSYVKLDGNVGCMVNGAGLAMSTMDIIKLNGGEPANFLDVGGAANAATVAKGFEIILRDPNVKSIFVNIFGGIVRCDRIANGILEATEKTKVKIPLIVRLNGTNSVEAAAILKTANIDNIITATDLADGAAKAVNAAKGVL